MIATLAVGIPAAVAAFAAYFLSRSADSTQRVRQLITDLMAPVRGEVANLKDRVDDLCEDVEELKRDRHPHP